VLALGIFGRIIGIYLGKNLAKTIAYHLYPRQNQFSIKALILSLVSKLSLSMTEKPYLMKFKFLSQRNLSPQRQQ
jgi:hypothetical protein